MEKMLLMENKRLYLRAVDNEGYAILKESMNIEYSEREEQRVLERQREKEAKEAELRRSRELFSKHCTFEED